MIWMHKETAELYEMLIKSLDDSHSQDRSILHKGPYPIGEITFLGGQDPGTFKHDEMGDHFEFIG